MFIANCMAQVENHVGSCMCSTNFPVWDHEGGQNFEELFDVRTDFQSLDKILNLHSGVVSVVSDIFPCLI